MTFHSCFHNFHSCCSELSVWHYGFRESPRNVCTVLHFVIYVLSTGSWRMWTAFECDVTTYVKETVFVHVSKHLYDVSCTEGQLSLNRAINKQTDKKQNLLLNTQDLFVLLLILGVCKPDLYVSVGGAFSWIIVKDGDHPASSWGWVPHSCSGLAGICQLNTETGKLKQFSLTSWQLDNGVISAIPISPSACSSSAAC